MAKGTIAPRKQIIHRATARTPSKRPQYNRYGELVRKQTPPELEILSVTTKPNRPVLVNVDEELRSTNTGKRKSAFPEGGYEESGDHTLRINQSKRTRTVAPVRAMGTKVSQLVEGYEQHQQQVTAANGGTGNTSLANIATQASTSQITQTPRTNNLGHHYRALRHSMSRHQQIKPATSRFQLLQYNHDVVQAAMSKVDRPRSWTCHCCLAQGMPYDFEAHMEYDLACPRNDCGHKCCGYCVIDSVGERCEEKPWHGHKKGYWGWMMDMGLEVDNEGEASGEYVETKSFL